jgi:hypothetical protein
LASWKLTSVARIEFPNGEGLYGFSLQEEGRSPSLSMGFESEAAAEKYRAAVQQFVDNAVVIVHNNR